MAVNTGRARRFFLKTLSLCCLLFTMGISSVQGQLQHVADSLRHIYEADTLKGRDRLILLRDLAFNESNNPEQALDYANELISRSREMGNTEFLYSGYMQKGNSQLNQGDLDLVLDAYKNAEEIAEKDGSRIRQSTALFSLAYTYSESGDLKRAEEHFEKSLEVLRDPEVESHKAGKWALAEALFNAGDFYLRQGQYGKAETHLLEAGALFQELEFNTGYAYYLGNMGVLYIKTGALEQARSYLTKAIQMLEEDQDFAPVAEYQTKLAELYIAEEDFGQGHSLATRALEHALRLNLTNQISETSAVLASLDSITGNYEEAYSHLSLHMAYKDSMDLATVDMTRLEREKAELQVRQQESELVLRDVQQKRQQLTLWAVGITALLLTIIALGSYKRYRYIKNTNEIISQERDRSDSLLQNILPKQTAMELKKMGRVRAQRFDEVSVLFTDFKGFTSHAESMDPEKLVKSIDYYFSRFDAIMDKYGLEKIKTVGDAYMCASGLPYPSEDHAFKITQAALEILEFVEEAKKEASEDHVRFDIRIGINSGPVVAGVVGTKKFAYDIWGDTVNIAARMESSSDVGRINIAENTYELIKDDFECEYRGNIEVKNRGKLNMYFVQGKKAQSHSA